MKPCCSRTSAPVHDLLESADTLPSANLVGCSDEKACGINSAKANVRQIFNAIHFRGFLAYQPPPPTWRSSVPPPQKRPPSGSPARPHGLPGGSKPARLRQPAPIGGKLCRSPRPAPGFGEAFAILKPESAD